jgi:hypothetical protein
MYPEPITIFLGTALIHLPQNYEETDLRKFYAELAEKAKAYGCNYEAFSIVGANSADLQTKRPEFLSRCLVRHDRICIEESASGVDIEGFVARVNEVAGIATDVLKTKMYIIQSCNVQCIFRPSSTKDARIFLSEKVCNLAGGDKIFPHFDKKPAHLFGIRLSFLSTPDQPFAFDLRIESYNRNTSSIFTENIGNYMGQPIAPDNLKPLEANIRKTVDFLKRNTFQFLQQFDI